MGPYPFGVRTCLRVCHSAKTTNQLRGGGVIFVACVCESARRRRSVKGHVEHKPFTASSSSRLLSQPAAWGGSAVEVCSLPSPSVAPYHILYHDILRLYFVSNIVYTFVYLNFHVFLIGLCIFHIGSPIGWPLFPMGWPTSSPLCTCTLSLLAYSSNPQGHIEPPQPRQAPTQE